jgi:thiol-disulfide isomerase/thioredoxin
MSLTTREQFLNLIQDNTGLIVIKFGASWCGPCKVIHKEVQSQFKDLPSHIVCYDLDIDDCPDLYSYLKKRRQIRGVPTIMAFHHYNKSGVPDLTHSGSDIQGVQRFFNTVNNMTI